MRLEVSMELLASCSLCLGNIHVALGKEHARPFPNGTCSVGEEEHAS